MMVQITMQFSRSKKNSFFQLFYMCLMKGCVYIPLLTTDHRPQTADHGPRTTGNRQLAIGKNGLAQEEITAEGSENFHVDFCEHKWCRVKLHWHLFDISAARHSRKNSQVKERIPSASFQSACSLHEVDNGT